MVNLEKELLETMRLVWNVKSSEDYAGCYIPILPIAKKCILRSNPKIKREWRIYFIDRNKLCVKNWFEEEFNGATTATLHFDQMIYNHQKDNIRYICEFSNNGIMEWCKYLHIKPINPTDIVSLVRRHQLCQKEVQEKLLNFLKINLISIL